MKPIVIVFARSPGRRRGLAGDMRVRWALKEVGQPYEVRLVSFAERPARGRRFESNQLNAALPVSGHEGRGADHRCVLNERQRCTVADGSAGD